MRTVCGKDGKVLLYGTGCVRCDCGGAILEIDGVTSKAQAERLSRRAFGFDLGLWPYEGNCDYCFLKGLQVLAFQERERPGSIDDWIEMERQAAGLTANPLGARFVTEYSYVTVKDDTARQPLLFPIDPMHLEAEGECGVGGTDTQIRCGART